MVTLQVAKGTLVPRVPTAALDPQLWRGGGGGRMSLAAGIHGECRGTSAPRRSLRPSRKP